MSRRCINVLFLFILFSGLQPCYSQYRSYGEEYKFLLHLATEHLYQERLHVINHLSPSDDKDKIFLEKAWTFSALEMYDSAFRYYRFAPLDSIAHSIFGNDYARILFRTFRWNELKEYVRHPAVTTTSGAIELDFYMRLIEKDISLQDLDDRNMPENIKIACKQYYRASRRSPLLGATYSLIIPGLGKWYAGKKRQAWNMFLANAALGLQSYEAWRKDGFQSTRFIIFGSLFSVAYITNIVGSAISVNKSKRDYRYQLHYEINNYYFNQPVVYPDQF